MKRVAIITNIPSPYRVDLFHYMQKNSDEFEFHVIYTSKSEDNRQWKLDSKKLINSHILESKVIKVKGKLDSRYIHLPRNVGSQLDKIAPDVVIAWEYNLAAVQAMLWCKMKKHKFVHLTDGTLYSERNINVVQKILRKLICATADSCIASSSKAREKLIAWGVRKDKIFISLLTVDVSGLRSVGEKKCKNRVLYVGSMIKRKGLDLLIEALKYVEVSYELKIVGNGTEKEKRELEILSEKNKCQQNIEWLGYKEGQDLISEYEKASVFVLPTREDCFGLVLLEALCMKTPIVSSKYADGAYDIVVDGKNGIIADPFNPKEFGKAIEECLVNPDYQEAAAAISAEKFFFENVVSGYYTAIRCALEN